MQPPPVVTLVRHDSTHYVSMEAMQEREEAGTMQQLQAEVELLRNEARHKDADLRLTTSALLAIHNGAKIQDLVEVNLALDEQVKSLKKMVQLMLQPQPQHGASHTAAPSRVGMRRSTSAKLSVHGGEPYEVVLGCGGSSDDPIHIRNNVRRSCLCFGLFCSLLLTTDDGDMWFFCRYR